MKLLKKTLRYFMFIVLGMLTMVVILATGGYMLYAHPVITGTLLILIIAFTLAATEGHVDV